VPWRSWYRASTLRAAHEPELEVCDRGNGIDSAHAARVVEPFVSTKREGTGLGLAIASEVAHMHRGRLGLKPRDGGGTCAVLRLPAESPPDDHASPGPAA